MTVVVLNPLGAGLAHYTTSLEHVLQVSGVPTERVNITEPSSAAYGRARWLSTYLYRTSQVLVSHKPRAVIATWATLGYLDLPILSAISRTTPMYIVMHDPRPLVYARGYGVAPRMLARRAVLKGKFVSHSNIASRAIREDAGIRHVVDVPHPMLAPAAVPRDTSPDKTIRVLGQYKQDRDMSGLRQLAHDAPSSWRLEVIGRGWPPIEGWQVTSDFVDEDSFDQLIQGSHVVLIPYTRFFQSGVAIRALEAGIPVVGPHQSSLAELLGNDCPWLVRNGIWSQSVDAAINARPDEVLAKAQESYEDVVSQWSHVLTQEHLR
jgi:hypothetical protein